VKQLFGHLMETPWGTMKGQCFNLPKDNLHVLLTQKVLEDGDCDLYMFIYIYVYLPLSASINQSSSLPLLRFFSMKRWLASHRSGGPWYEQRSASCSMGTRSKAVGVGRWPFTLTYGPRWRISGSIPPLHHACMLCTGTAVTLHVLAESHL